MDDLKKLDMSMLLDMLAKYTSDYTRILKDGGTKEDYESCKVWINHLTKEIELRKGQGSN